MGAVRLSEMLRGSIVIQQRLFDDDSPTKWERVRRDQTSFLKLAVSRFPNAVSVDEIPGSEAKFTDGGKWRGPGIRDLCERGLIRACGAKRSDRKSRKMGLTSVWTVADFPKAVSALNRMIEQQKTR
jgi:hypothetical protein